MDEDQFKKCPFCAESIRLEAVICRFCNRSVTQPVSAERKKRIRPAFKVLGILLLLFVGYSVFQIWTSRHGNASTTSSSAADQGNSADAATPPPAPVMGWATAKNDTFVLDPGAGITGYNVPGDTAKFKPKVVIHATSPVTIAYVPTSFRSSVEKPSTQSMPVFHCLQSHVLNTTLQCDLEPWGEGYVLWIHDERTVGQELGAGILGGLGIKGPAEQAVARNDVSVEYSLYGCIQNCR